MVYKVIILAGGLGTRLSEETQLKPKPMVEIGGTPILLHIMKIFTSQINCEFLIATGYKSSVIETYLESYEFKKLGIKARAIFTGDQTATGGRVKRVMEIYPEDTFFMTYGDGVANVNLTGLIKFHKSHDKLATVTAVRPAARFGRLEISNGVVTSFAEKLQTHEGWINGGFLVLNPKVSEFIHSQTEMFEQEPMSRLTKNSQLMAFMHYGFWQPMDTIREKNELDRLARLKQIPWLTM